jgi:hypothetical protein
VLLKNSTTLRLQGRNGDKPTKWQRMLISDWPVIRKPSLPQSCSAEEASG